MTRGSKRVAFIWRVIQCSRRYFKPLCTITVSLLLEASNAPGCCATSPSFVAHKRIVSIMLPSARSAAAILALLVAPILYVGREKISLELPSAITPVNPAIQRFQEYLRIRTDHPHPSYLEAQLFLNRTVIDLLPNVSYSAHTFVPGKPVLLFKLDGTDEHLQALLLNSHTDVVPSEDEKWDWPPYAARTVLKDGQLRVYARGSQDMKSVGLQYVEALSELLRTNWRPKRTIYISFVPDEEIGGKDGMEQLIESDLFPQLNLGVALDEGLPRDDGMFNCYYGERQTWWLSIKVADRPGHGSNLPDSTAAATLNAIISKVMQFRDGQLKRLKDGVDMGEIIGVNVAYLKGGYADDKMSSGFTMNVIPSDAEAGFDIRVPPTVSANTMDEEIESWITCGDKRCPGVTLHWVMKVNNAHVTSRDPEENPYAIPFMNGLKKAGIAEGELNHGIFRAATDARFLRLKGIPSFGFSPINRSPNLLHKHNEYLPVDTYLRGIRIYMSIIQEIADYDINSDVCEACEENTESTESVMKEDL
eukprot:TRINITY_DN365_c0_g2_i1.p1 TRINITY_DN365_c0_g2~~TRINITY_DN365_c0_g2_i1.p1  ORF type:complete len:533 (+),score=77.06 TRINITY_DN365_c0_g2_i1:2466-4064(+)